MGFFQSRMLAALAIVGLAFSLIFTTCATAPGVASAAKEYYSIGLLFETQKDTQNAVEMYKKAIQIDPTYRMARYNLALVYIQRNELENARGLLEGLRTEDPDNQSIAESIAYLAAKQGKPEEALEGYKKIAEVTAGRAAVLYNLALISRELNLMEQAFAYAERLMVLAPEEPQYSKLAGLLALKLDKQDEAERLMARYVKSIEKDIAALVAFAQDLESQAYHARSLDLLEKALEIDPKNMSASILKVKILANGAEDTERAKVALKKIMEIGSIDEAALVGLVRAVPGKDRPIYIDLIKEFKKDFGKDISFDDPAPANPAAGTTTVAPVAGGSAAVPSPSSTIPLDTAPSTTTTVRSSTTTIKR